MSDDLITPENLSAELLKSMFDAAYMEATLDGDGDLIVREAVTCYVIPNKEKKDRIKLLTQFGFKPNCSELERLQAVNKINEEYIIVRAVAGPNDTLRFDWDIVVVGGVSKKALVFAVKRFCSIPQGAIADHASALVK